MDAPREPSGTGLYGASRGLEGPSRGGRIVAFWPFCNQREQACTGLPGAWKGLQEGVGLWFFGRFAINGNTAVRAFLLAETAFNRRVEFWPLLFNNQQEEGYMGLAGA